MGSNVQNTEIRLSLLQDHISKTKIFNENWILIFYFNISQNFNCLADKRVIIKDHKN